MNSPLLCHETGPVWRLHSATRALLADNFRACVKFSDDACLVLITENGDLFRR